MFYLLPIGSAPNSPNYERHSLVYRSPISTWRGRLPEERRERQSYSPSLRNYPLPMPRCRPRGLSGKQRYGCVWEGVCVCVCGGVGVGVGEGVGEGV